MTITLTKISAKQFKSIGTVILWIGASVGLSAGLAWVTSRPDLFLTTAPAINLVGVFLSKVFQQEADQAIANLPADLQEPATTLEVDAKAEVGKVFTPTATTAPADAPTAPADPQPAVGSTPGN